MKRLALLLLPAALIAGQARYARLGEFSGSVEVQLTAADAWMAAERNLPLPESAWVRTGTNARVEIEFDDGSVCRLGADSQGELSDYARLSTGQRVTLVSLDHGTAYFTGRPQGKDALTLAAPGMQATFVHAGRIRVEAGDTATRLSVLEGSVRFSSPTAELDLMQGQFTRVEPAHPTVFEFDRGIDEKALDQWSAGRDKSLAAPASRTHVVEHYGLTDLDTAGKWIDTEKFGTVWQPTVPADWAPFQQGRWRWYDALGYTWVSSDTWGWLPFHYGRWARTPELGWIWTPSLSQVFQPGPVYWMTAERIAGWGPLAPGERWDATAQPQQFLNAHTTWAAFLSGANTIDPAGFTGRPKEPLQTAAFALALPSPVFLMPRLEALRPVVSAGSTRVAPSLQGVTFDDATALADSMAPRMADIPATPPEPGTPEPPAMPPPIMIAPDAPATPETIAVPYAVPYPVLAGTLRMEASSTATTRQTQQAKPAATTTKPATSTASDRTAKSGRKTATNPTVLPIVPPKRPRDAGEVAIYNQALADTNDAARQLVDLEAWSRRYPASDYDDDRSVLYMQAYSKLNHPDRVVEHGARLLAKGLDRIFTDPAAGPTEILNVLYLTTSSGQLLHNPRPQDAIAITAAARGLQEYMPVYFDDRRKPSSMSATDWQRARAFMESTARKTLVEAARWPRAN